MPHTQHESRDSVFVKLKAGNIYFDFQQCHTHYWEFKIYRMDLKNIKQWMNPVNRINTSILSVYFKELRVTKHFVTFAELCDSQEFQNILCSIGNVTYDPAVYELEGS